MHNTITQDEAAKRGEDYLRQAIMALPPQARPEPFGPITFDPCDDPTDRGPRGRVEVSHRYKINGLPPAENSRHIDLVKQWWESHGWRVLSDDRRTNGRHLWVENTADSFHMSITSNPGNELYIGVTSPCVWPKGTPEPTGTALPEPASSGDQPAVAQPPQPKPVARRRRPTHDEDEEDLSLRETWKKRPRRQQ
ncbi:hypothetical protein EV193_108170 [Herbihabitans rhizosphaerae]|uniref:Uncharacterized protein n=2 Tax=Herbihabitans rhizosphaerae TaxID=1872711 RepID=A0A4Q7KIR0_9PSEU|nr:hypothetical protein EV193_108170 [Herbihabitans rhizosphaerae]